MISSCPTRPPRLLVSSIQPVPQNMSPLTLVVTLITLHITLPVHALLDSGSAGSFISGSLCRQLKIPTAVNPKTFQIQSITGKSLSRHNVRYLTGPITLCVGHLHEENIQLLVLENATPTSGTSFARRRPLNYLHTGHGTARYICYRVSQCPKGKSFPCHSQSKRPWRSI